MQSGLRILLHPRPEPLLDKQTMRIVPVEPSEKMRLNVQSEVNYLEYPRDDHLGPDYEDCIQFDCLLRMLSEPHERFQYHYLEKFSTWNRMRAQLGRAPYPREEFLDRDEYDHT